MLLPQQFKDRIGLTDSNGCWPWTGNLTSRDARAYIWWKGKTRIAARVMMIDILGYTLQTNECVLHTCDNPACINPDHLYIGTQSDNAKDRQSRNRNKAFNKTFKGEANGASKLTKLQAQEILDSSESYKTLAQKFAVGRSNIGSIKRGVTWSHLKKGR